MLLGCHWWPLPKSLEIQADTQRWTSLVFQKMLMDKAQAFITPQSETNIPAAAWYQPG